MRTRLIHARLIDGTGAAAREGELLVEDGVIAEVGDTTLPADETVDARGMVIAPGFIDVHSHSDFTLPARPLAAAKVHQGITTEVVGNCGLGLSPANERVEQMYAHIAPMIFGEAVHSCSPRLSDYRERLQEIGISVNAAVLIPHGNVRCAAMGMADREATTAELEHMREVVAEGMEDGAFGLSSGLIYPPGAFAPTEELTALARVIAPYAGIYASHIRDEGMHVVESVAEAIDVGEAAGCAVQISHHKAAGRLNWHKVERTLALVDAARARGTSVNSDVYPYTAGSTVLAAMCLPTWAFEGSNAEMMSRLRDPPTRRRIIADGKARLLRFVRLPGVLGLIPRRWLLPFILSKLSEKVVISSVKRQHDLEGKSLAEITKARGKPLFDVILDLLVEEDAAILAIAHVMHEDDVRAVMRHAATLIGTDGFVVADGKPHPRAFGTFPRVLGRYVREWGVLGLEEAIHRMTAMTATKLGMTDRGVLAPGAAADLVVFDPDTISDTATYDRPRESPRGIPHVMVGGTWAVRSGKHTGARSGRVLERPTAR